jgi:hypothetical protein
MYLRAPSTFGGTPRDCVTHQYVGFEATNMLDQIVIAGYWSNLPLLIACPLITEKKKSEIKLLVLV